jgi:type II secretory pathway component GspD/PulD (secretin)
MKATRISLLFAIVAGAAAAADPPASVKLDFPNNDVNEVLALYESLTRFNIVRDNKVRGKIQILAMEPVTPDKAIQMIEHTLFSNGFGIIQIDPQTVQVIGVGGFARDTAVPTLSEPGQLPKQERLVSYFFQFRHADAEKVQQAFARYLSPMRPYTIFLRPPGVNALWVTERSSVIRELITVAEKIDVASPEQRTP